MRSLGISRRWLLAVAVSASALGLAACGSSGSSSGSGSSGSGTTSGGGGGKLTQVKVALYPSTDYAPLYVGIRAGVFRRAGLDIQVQQVLTGTGLTAAITSGKVDIGTNSPASMVTGIANNLPVRMVSASDTMPTTGYADVLVKSSSPIKGWGDLAGRTVATINLQGVFELGVLNAVQKAGGNPATVRALAMAPTDEVAALQAGRVDAIVLQDPFVAPARANPAFRSLGNPFGQLSYRVVAAGYFASDSVIGKKAAMLTKFRTALQQATDMTAANPELARQAIPTYTQLRANVARTIGLPIYSTDAPQDSITSMVSQMSQFGWIKRSPTYDQIVWGGS